MHSSLDSKLQSLTIEPINVDLEKNIGILAQSMPQQKSPQKLWLPLAIAASVTFAIATIVFLSNSQTINKPAFNATAMLGTELHTIAEETELDEAQWQEAMLSL